MDFWRPILQFMNTQMEEPACYGWYHLLWLGLMIFVTVMLCIFRKHDDFRQVRRLVLTVALITIVLEIYKQINYTFGDGSSAPEYLWYAFPWQFCSTPMYVGLLAGLTPKGKFHDALCAYLATFSIFAGVCVMLYPGDVFIETAGINIQTMICHGSMITVGAYLLATGHVKLEHKTVLKAVPVFAVTVGIAMILNEVAHATGLLENHNFNMFYISPYCDPSLPVYSLVQQVVPYPWSLLIYIAGFTAAAYVMLLVAMLIRRLAAKVTVAKHTKELALKSAH